MAGSARKDLIIKLPVGSVVTNLENRKEYRVIRCRAENFDFKGGKGGLGNEHLNLQQIQLLTNQLLVKRAKKGILILNFDFC